jgi:RNA polymerase sigma factor (sigma-70 family)
MPAGDERLAQLVKTGHEQAFAVLYHRYHQRLYRYCRSMLGNDSDAQDALQSTFAGAFAALAEGRRDAPVRPWLYRIAHNESVSIMRRRKPDVALVDDHLRPAASAAEVAESRGRLELLIADLSELTERQRAALVMRELSGLSHAEIATALKLDVSAAKHTIFEARRSLQEFAEGRAMVCDEVCRAISAGGGRSLRGRRVRSHLRDCRACQAFADAIPARSRDLKAIAPPLAGTAAVSILRRASASTSSHGGGVGGTVAGSAGKAAGMLAAGKALAGAAAVVTVAAGAGGIVGPLVSLSPPGTGKVAAQGPVIGQVQSGRQAVISSAQAAVAAGVTAGTRRHHRTDGLKPGSRVRSRRGAGYGAARGHQHAGGESQSAPGASHGRGHSRAAASASHGQAASRSARATERRPARGTARATPKATGKSHSTPTARASGRSLSHAAAGQTASSARAKRVTTTNSTPLSGLTPSGPRTPSSKTAATPQRSSSKAPATPQTPAVGRSS